MIFQTAGPTLGEGDPLPVLVAPMPANGASRVSLPRGQALGHVCFSAVTRDLAGHVSAATPEDCDVTDHPPFFEGCSVGSMSAHGRAFASGTWTVACLLAICRRRRYAPPVQGG